MNKGRDTIGQFPVQYWGGELSKIVDSRGTVYRSNSIDIDSQQPDGNGTVRATPECLTQMPQKQTERRKE